MTLIYEFDLNILKMYPQTKNEVSRSRLSNVRAQTNRSTDALGAPKALYTVPHLWVAIIRA